VKRGKLKIGITGTPGTGKSSVAKMLAEMIDYELVDLNEIVEKQKFYDEYDEARGCYVVNVGKLCEYIARLPPGLVVEGHLAHLCKLDLIVVLRCKPNVLKERLRSKGWSAKKIKENVEAEILDIVTQEAVEINQNVYEIDTTYMSVRDVSETIIKIMSDSAFAEKFKPGNVSWDKEMERLVGDDTHDNQRDG